MSLHIHVNCFLSSTLAFMISFACECMEAYMSDPCCSERSLRVLVQPVWRFPKAKSDCCSDELIQQGLQPETPLRTSINLRRLMTLSHQPRMSLRQQTMTTINASPKSTKTQTNLKTHTTQTTKSTSRKRKTNIQISLIQSPTVPHVVQGMQLKET